MASNGKGVVGSNKLVLILALVLMVGVFIGAMKFFSGFTQSDTYYVLNTDVPQQTLITADMIVPVETQKDSAPKNAIDISEIRLGKTYARVPLRSGDVLSQSNTGGNDDISLGVPDSWVVTSFSVAPADAVGGRITKGYYFDMLILDGSGQTTRVYYPFVNMLALDTTVSLGGNQTESQGTQTSDGFSGSTSQYYVGMPPKEAAKLHQIISSAKQIKLLLSPIQNEYQAVDLTDYTIDGAPVAPIDMGIGTDSSGVPIERDEMYRPKDIDGSGNRIYPQTCGHRVITGKDKVDCESLKVDNNTYSDDAASQ